MTRQFKAGYPFFNNENINVMIYSLVNGKSISYCGHTNDCCDKILENTNNYYYYYKINNEEYD